jgi:hypothetical protein
MCQILLIYAGLLLVFFGSLSCEWLMPHWQICQTMVAIAVKRVSYRSVEIFFDKFVDVGKGDLGIYKPPGGSEIIYFE